MDKLDHYKSKWEQIIETKRKINGKDKEIIEYDKWMKYIKEPDKSIQRKKRKIQVSYILFLFFSHSFPF